MTKEDVKNKYPDFWSGDIVQSGDWIEYIDIDDVAEIIENEIKENNDIHSVMRSNKLKPNQVIVDKEHLATLQKFFDNYA
tara:strand:+ start:1017 stop:1256 length:240 start_codon:yes stop_codon:yes gene_type:complete